VDAALRQAQGKLADGDTVGAPRGRRHLLLPLLHTVQDRFGWISPGALNYVSERLGVAPADVYGVATFYASLATAPRSKRVVHVCDDIACCGRGAKDLLAALASQGTAVLRSPCLGLCDRAPAVLIETAGDAPSAVAIAPATPELHVPPVQTHIGGSPLRLLRRIGTVDPERLDAYRSNGGYEALARALELRPERIVAEVTASNLLGRGGAAFPTGRKMQSVATQPAQPHYLVCNADESEPGTFKDRVLMEGDPFAVVEAMTIGAYAIGSERGYIYIRGEYPLAAQRLANAIAQARAAGLLGERVMGSGMRFDIELRRGAGAYICGEETALFNSIEGKRGEPRSKPPFPVESGLFGKPTQVNNVETLANLPCIVLEGGEVFARIGTPNSTGTRLFSVSGSISQPGLYEVPHGTTLAELLDLAGGIAPGSRLQAILLGGAAGTFVAPDALAMPLTFEDARDAGATLGSGVVMVFDETVDMMGILRRMARFFRDESCGQCVPCRVGTVRQEEALERGDFQLLGEIGRVMRDASICGLGQTAASAIESARTNLKLW
jgi:NADH-quinone oxidoreductase subunit F